MHRTSFAMGRKDSPMIRTTLHNRSVFQIENDQIRVSVTQQGGHIAEILEKSTGTSPLWVPPWPSIEPSSWSPQRHPEYGQQADAKLLSGIMGHSLCLDLFGPPSEAEQAAGMMTHGEAGVISWTFEPAPDGLCARCDLPSSQLAFERYLTLKRERVRIRETVQNLSSFDRPIAWTQHVTLGPPFLEKGRTQFHATIARAYSTDGQGCCIGCGSDCQATQSVTRTLSDARSFGGYRACLMDQDQINSHFVAWSPATKTAIAYVWNTADFPWMGIWDENHSRDFMPWNGRTLARGMEFGVSPFPESRRHMIERGSFQGHPAYKWIPAHTAVTAEYYAEVIKAESMPPVIEYSGGLARC